MAHKYHKLLSPVKLPSGVVIKNALAGAHLTASLIHGPETYITEALNHHYVQAARNGASIIDWYDVGRGFGGILPPNEDLQHNVYTNFSFDNPRMGNTLSLLADEVHAYGTKILLSVYFSSLFWPQGTSFYGSPGRTMMSTHGPTKMPGQRECTKEELQGVIRQVVDYARDFVSWGFDGISLHMGYFLYEGSDHRTDEYGGTPENRARFIGEVFDALKKEFGPQFIICGIMQAKCPQGVLGETSKGFGIDDTVRFLKTLEGKLDYVQLRPDDFTQNDSNGFTNTKDYQISSTMLEHCRYLKAAGVKTPLAPNTGFRDPDVMERALEEGDCEFFCLTRAFLSDYDYYRKIVEERTDELTPCIICNKCHGTGRAPWVNFCSVEPRQGINHKNYHYMQPSGKKKNVAVIGGGPVGMRAAIMAVDQGHNVTLYEKTGYLGGVLSHADYFSFKWPLKDYRLWLINMLEKKKVQIQLNHQPTPEEIACGGFDVVLACTGATPSMPKIEGVLQSDGSTAAGVINCYDVWGHEDELGQKIVMVGGANVAVETAIHLAQLGKDVTLLTRNSKVGHNCDMLHSITMSHIKRIEGEDFGFTMPEWSKYDNLHTIVLANTTKVQKGKATYNKDGQEHYIDCDTIVINGGVTPNIDEALRYSGLTTEFYTLGDVESKDGNLQKGNRNAYAIVSRL